MRKDFTTMPLKKISIDAGKAAGNFEWHRHSLCSGAVNSTPLPDRVIQGLKKLKPGRIRIFLQEYFDIYPDHGKYDWRKLDPYMESFAKTGAEILVSITCKPKAIYPVIDQDIWKPNNVAEWQDLMYQLAKRYSVDKPYVTYWEHANESDIGEWGGCPFRIKKPEDNHEFYAMTMEPILRAAPKVKVGGPAISNVFDPIMKGFIDGCAKAGTRLDFVSWHCYDDEINRPIELIKAVNGMLENFPGKKPELMINEWNQMFAFQVKYRGGYDLVSVDEIGRDPRRSAFTAANLFGLHDSGIDWTNYFLLWDSCMYHSDFKKFYSDAGARAVMYRHWNEMPTRWGLFSEDLRLRPQYFVFQILARMNGERLVTSPDDQDIKVRVARDGKRLSIMIVNFHQTESRDHIVQLEFKNLKPGIKYWTAYRIDENCKWSEEEMELIPFEKRKTDTIAEYDYQFYAPADSVTLAILEYC